ncbi:MAG: hypothetical protein U5Q03_14935 [Bacteroidota bacterium]|nr:hypothetical protein [Bacteroidota bacterium]
MTTGEDLTLTLCQLDLELISILTGGEVLLTAPAKSSAWKRPTLAPLLRSLPSSPGPRHMTAHPRSPLRDYWHWVWPGTRWNIGDWTIERGILQVGLTGRAQANANAGLGSFNDWPGAGIQQFFGVFLASDEPESDVSPYNQAGLSCGFIDLPANAS